MKPEMKLNKHKPTCNFPTSKDDGEGGESGGQEESSEEIDATVSPLPSAGWARAQKERRVRNRMLTRETRLAIVFATMRNYLVKGSGDAFFSCCALPQGDRHMIHLKSEFSQPMTWNCPSVYRCRVPALISVKVSILSICASAAGYESCIADAAGRSEMPNNERKIWTWLATCGWWDNLITVHVLHVKLALHIDISLPKMYTQLTDLLVSSQSKKSEGERILDDFFRNGLVGQI